MMFSNDIVNEACAETWIAELVVFMWQLVGLIVSAGVLIGIFVAMLALVVNCYCSVRNRE